MEGAGGGAFCNHLMAPARHWEGVGVVLRAPVRDITVKNLPWSGLGAMAFEFSSLIALRAMPASKGGPMD